MRETFRNLKGVAQLHQGTTDLDELALEYQQTRNEVILAFAFVELYPYIMTQMYKYFNLTEADKASFAMQELDKALLDYRTGKGAKLKTFFSRYLNRRLYAETSMMNHQLRSANNQCSSYELETENVEESTGKIKHSGMKYQEERYEKIEMEMSLNDKNVLTENEVKYCKIILRESASIVGDSEVARELNITPSAVNQMKKALKKKFVKLSLCV